MPRLSGLSPKVGRPAIALTLVGAILVVLGLALRDSTLTTAGVAALGSAGIQLPIGFGAPIGHVSPAVLPDPTPDPPLLPGDPLPGEVGVSAGSPPLTPP